MEDERRACLLVDQGLGEPPGVERFHPPIGRATLLHRTVYGNPSYFGQLRRDLRPVQLPQMRLDLTRGKPTGIQGNDLLVEARETALILRNQLRLKAAVATRGILPSMFTRDPSSMFDPSGSSHKPCTLRCTPMLPLTRVRLVCPLDGFLPPMMAGSLLKVPEDAFNLFQGTAEVFREVSRQDMRVRQLGRVFQRLVLQPEDVEAALVSRNDLTR